MLTVEVRINGTLIGYAHVTNQGGPFQEQGVPYNYEYYQPELGTMLKGSVNHDRDKGPVELCKKIFDGVVKQKSKMAKG